MKLLTVALFLSTLAAPSFAIEAPVAAVAPDAAAVGTLPAPDGFDRRSGRCHSREGSPCGGV